ncbi:MAG: putative toxin-antitoxin system toxin component, PIN family [Nitrospiraceae bacterium]
MRVVVDTNIFVSGLIASSGPPATIVDAVLRGTLTAVFSEETLSELTEVLRRPRFSRYFTARALDLESVIADISQLIELVETRPSNKRIRDRDDRPFVDLRLTSPRPIFFVTGDRVLTEDLSPDIPMISPAAFVRLLRTV